jgi:hypothetical protein
LHDIVEFKFIPTFMNIYINHAQISSYSDHYDYKHNFFHLHYTLSQLTLQNITRKVAEINIQKMKEQYAPEIPMFDESFLVRANRRRMSFIEIEQIHDQIIH